MPHVTLAQGTIHYTDDGPRDAPVVVLLHGLLVDGRLWRKVVPGLSDRARVVVPDLPLGAHRTPLAPGSERTPAGVARLVADLLEALDLRDVTLVGSDTGGALSQLVAADHPERLARLVLVSCDAFENFPPGFFKQLMPLLGSQKLIRPTLLPLKLRPLLRLPIAFGWLTKRPIPPEVTDAWLAAFFSARGVREDAAAFMRAIDPATTLAVAERLPSFTKPVLVLWAREDRLFPPAHAGRLAALFADARVQWVEDSYAFVSEDQPEVTAAAIGAFVRERAIA